MTDYRELSFRMGQSLRTAGVVAVASEFDGVASVAAVLGAILTALGRYAIAGRMGALFILTHKISNPPSVGRFCHPFVSGLKVSLTSRPGLRPR